MAHLRTRHSMTALLKKLKFSRVVSIQGARQTGKSTLARDLLSYELKSSEYVTFDKTLDRQLVTHQPDSFLESHSGAAPLTMDEAQKVPGIFDAVKLRVDQNNRPGQYLLLGSTEFSQEVQIKESLTGRLSRLLIFPLTIAESLNLPFKYHADFKSNTRNNEFRASRKLFFRYLNNGGFPGIFAIRSDIERKNLMSDWLRLVTERDLQQFKKIKTDSELALNILELLPILESPDLNSLSKKIRINAKKIKTHLDLLEQLFAIHSVKNHSLGSGKKLYYLCDVGLVEHLKGDLKRKLETWLHQEVLAQRSYSMVHHTQYHYYRSARGSRIDLIIENETEVLSIKIFDTEMIDLREFEILYAFKKKMSAVTKKRIRLIALGPYLKCEHVAEVELLPWETLV